MQRNDVIRFDPANLNELQQKQLHALLQAAAANGRLVIKSDQTYSFSNPNQELELPEEGKFQLINCACIYKRPCINSTYGYRFEVVAGAIENGNFGVVHAGSGTFEPSRDGSLNLKKSNRAHKFYKINRTSPTPAHLNQNTANRDAANKLALHLHSKTMVPMPGANDSEYQIAYGMRLFSGKELFSQMNDIWSKDFDSILYAQRLVYAYRRQVSQLGITHGDTKIDNVVANLPSEFQYVDYDFAKKTTTEYKVATGSYGNLAPELYLTVNEGCQGVTLATEIYSLGILLADLFAERETYENYHQYKNQALNNTNLDSKYNDIKEKLNRKFPGFDSEIYDLLNKMISFNPEDRPTIKEVSLLLDRIVWRLHLRHLGLSVETSRTLTEQFDRMLDMRERYLALTYCQHAGEDELAKLIEFIESDFSINLPDISGLEIDDAQRSSVYHLFMSFLDTDLFNQSNCYLDITTRLDAVIKDYKQAIHSFRQELLKNAVSDNVRDHITQKFKNLLAKYPASIDSLPIIARKLNKLTTILKAGNNCISELPYHFETEEFASTIQFDPQPQVPSNIPSSQAARMAAATDQVPETDTYGSRPPATSPSSFTYSAAARQNSLFRLDTAEFAPASVSFSATSSIDSVDGQPDQEEHIVVLSLDYDGCAEWLFDHSYAHYDNDSQTQLKIYNGVIKERFIVYLNQIIAEEADKAGQDARIRVIVMIGSMRQSLYLDLFSNQTNRNGLCSENYRELCSANGWEFDTFLLADKQNNFPAGCAIELREIKQSATNPNKTEIVDEQLKHLKEKYPAAKIHYHFIDDDAHEHKILDSLHEKFNAGVPDGIDMKLHQFCQLNLFSMLTYWYKDAKRQQLSHAAIVEKINYNVRELNDAEKSVITCRYTLSRPAISPAIDASNIFKAAEAAATTGQSCPRL